MVKRKAKQTNWRADKYWTIAYDRSPVHLDQAQEEDKWKLGTHTRSHSHSLTSKTVVKQFSLLHAKFARQTNGFVGPDGLGIARPSGSSRTTEVSQRRGAAKDGGTASGGPEAGIFSYSFGIR